MTQFNRITFDPLVMGGRACIRGLRITVALVVNLVANGMTAAQIIEEYPYLEEEDVRQSLQYAAWLADESVQIFGALRRMKFLADMGISPRVVSALRERSESTQQADCRRPAEIFLL